MEAQFNKYMPFFWEVEIQPQYRHFMAVATRLPMAMLFSDKHSFGESERESTNTCHYFGKLQYGHTIGMSWQSLQVANDDVVLKQPFV